MAIGPTTTFTQGNSAADFVLLNLTSIHKTLIGALRRGGSISAQISEKRGRRSSTNVGVRKLEWLLFLVVSKYLQSIIYRFITIHACERQTDRQTDRQNRDSNTVRCIACNCTVKTKSKHHNSRYLPEDDSVHYFVHISSLFSSPTPYEHVVLYQHPHQASAISCIFDKSQ